jgi:hypothetical protein
MSKNKSAAFDNLLGCFSNYSTLPKEAVLKQDILRLGIWFSESSLKQGTDYKTKDYFIFSFDLADFEEFKQGEQWKAPDEIRLSGGDWDLKPTVVSVRLNPKSPYQVKLDEGCVSLFLGETRICEVEYHPLPPYYLNRTQCGKSPKEVAPVIEWGYLVYLTVFRMCHYHLGNEACMFCDISHNYKKQIKSGNPYQMVKDKQALLETLDMISADFKQAKAITLTGGSILTELEGKTEVDFYSLYASLIKERYQDRFILKAVVQAFEKEDCTALKNSGVEIYHPNFEVWGKKMFSILCPGKEREIGYENWINRILDSADVFSPQKVIPNFVAGVELNSINGYKSVSEAVNNALDGVGFLMSQGILSRFTTWCPEPGSALGGNHEVPLQYYCQLLEGYRERFKHYKMPHPKGYGPVGAGKAVFSVSAFMDVLD